MARPSSRGKPDGSVAAVWLVTLPWSSYTPTTTSGNRQLELRARLDRHISQLIDGFQDMAALEALRQNESFLRGLTTPSPPGFSTSPTMAGRVTSVNPFLTGPHQETWPPVLTLTWWRHCQSMGTL